MFIEAAERFLKEGYNANFILIGDDIFGRNGKYRKNLFTRIEASPFSSNIQVVGWQDCLSPYWPQIDCVVHTADTEPFGRVIIEAMIHGIPVIAAESCGPAEIIEDSVTGLLFKPDDIEELIRAMQKITSDKGFACKLAENARQYVVSHFRAGQTAEKITKVYEQLSKA